MKKILFFVFLSPLILSVNRISAQSWEGILPQAHSRTYTTQPVFAFSPCVNAVQYNLHCTLVGKTYEKNRKKTVTKKLNATSGHIPEFFHWGDSVQWYYQAMDAEDNILFTSPEYAFSISVLPDHIQNKYELSIPQTTPSEELIFLSKPGMAINRTGQVQWISDTLVWGNAGDFQLHPDNSLTAIREINNHRTLMYANQVEAPPQLYTMPASITGTLDIIRYQYIDAQNRLILANHLYPWENRRLKYPAQIILILSPEGKLKYYWEADKFLTSEENFCFGNITDAYYFPAEGRLILNLSALSRVISFPIDKPEHVYAFQGVPDPALNMKINARRNAEPMQKVGAQDRGLMRLEVQEQRKESVSEQREFPYAPFSMQSSLVCLNASRCMMYNPNVFSKENTPNAIVFFPPQRRFAKMSDYSVLSFDSFCPENPGIKNHTRLFPATDSTLLVSCISGKNISELDTKGKVVWQIKQKENASPSPDSPDLFVSLSSSLYPLMFSLDCIQKGSENYIRITNTGKSADAYSIHIPGKVSEKTDWLQAGQSVRIKINESHVYVQSVQNSFLKFPITFTE